VCFEQIEAFDDWLSGFKNLTIQFVRTDLALYNLSDKSIGFEHNQYPNTDN